MRKIDPDKWDLCSTPLPCKNCVHHKNITKGIQYRDYCKAYEEDIDFLEIKNCPKYQNGVDGEQDE